MMGFGHAIGVMLAFMFLAGCCIAPPPGDGVMTGQDDGFIDPGQTGGEVISVTDTETTGGMSDPSKCYNLPPQQMADCLEDAMGD